MSIPVIRLRQAVQFPGSVAATSGIEVTKANGTWTFETDWSGFGTVSGVPTSPTNYVLTYDTVTRVYVLVPSSLLGGGGGGGIADAPIDGTQYGRQSGNWTAIAAPGLADAPSDGSSYGRLSAAWAKVAPLASPALTGTPTAPTAAPATNTTQIATTAFVGAAISTSGGVTPSALTRTNDTNVTLTLGGTPTTALLQSTSITAGWAGTLSTARGGFGSDISAQSGVPLFATGTPTFTATTGTGNLVRAISPTFTGTPAAPTATTGTNTTQVATTAFVKAQSTVKMVTFTRDLSLAAGNQSVTGVGFQPRFISFQTGKIGGHPWCSMGQADGTTNSCLELGFNISDLIGSFVQSSFAGFLREDANGTIYQAFTVASMDSDGFTITWIKSGSPTITANVTAICYA